MTLTIRFISSEEEDFVLDVKVSDKNTFAELHTIIRQTLSYSDALLSSFFISNEHWEKMQEITLVDMGENTFLMDKTKIGKFLTKRGQRVMYVFDYFTERLLFGTVVALSDTADIDTPIVEKMLGHVPPQMAPDNDQFSDDQLFADDELPSEEFDPDELSDEIEGGYYE